MQTILVLLFSVVALAKQEAAIELDLSRSIGPAVKALVTDSGAEKKANKCWTEVAIDYAGPKGQRVTSFQQKLPSLTKNAKPVIRIDPESMDRDRKLHISQRCDYSYTTTRACFDANNNLTTCTDNVTDDLVLHWECGLGAKIEKRAGAEAGLACNPVKYELDSHFSGKKLNRKILKTQFHDIPQSAVFRTQSYSRTASHTLAKPGSTGKKKLWIRFIEGVTGHMGEDDFRYSAEIDGAKFDFDVPEGQLNYDVEYVSDDTRVKITLSAIEVDVFFNDHYAPENSLELTTKPPGNSGLIRLKRRSYLGATSRDHQVTVIVTEDEKNLDANTAAVLGIQLQGDQAKITGVDADTRRPKAAPIPASKTQVDEDKSDPAR